LFTSESDLIIWRYGSPKIGQEAHVIFAARRYASGYMLSLCVSITSRHCTKMDKFRIMQRLPHDSPETLVFWCQRSWENLKGSSPTAAPNAGGLG